MPTNAPAASPAACTGTAVIATAAMAGTRIANRRNARNMWSLLYMQPATASPASNLYVCSPAITPAANAVACVVMHVPAGGEEAGGVSSNTPTAGPAPPSSA